MISYKQPCKILSIYFMDVQANIKMWKNSLSGFEAEGKGTAAQRRREAIKFYEEWLQTMHDSWDGNDVQTLVLQPRQQTLPHAAYKQTVLLPAGMSDSQVHTPFSMNIQD